MGESGTTEAKRYSGIFFDTFDTVVTIIGYSDSKETFDKAFSAAKERFTCLHQLFDKYNAYEGIENIYTLNKDAGTAPVAVSSDLMYLLIFCRDMELAHPGKVNIAMGRVLEIWHNYREASQADSDNAMLPPMAELQAAALHMDINDLILDEENCTVFFADPDLRLDVGAVAKGYAAEIVGQELSACGLTSFLLSAGGNMVAGDAPTDGRTAWSIGVQDPFGAVWDAEATIDSIYMTNGSVVTSGDYQRFYTVDGKKYHHIIDPETLMPSDYMTQITVIAESSAQADYYSTALFLMPIGQGKALVDSLAGVEAIWVASDGTQTFSQGYPATSRIHGATNLP